MASSKPDDAGPRWPPFNPFVRHPTSLLGKIKMILFGSILLPIRIVGAIVTLLLALVWANLASLGCDPAVPYTPFRRKVLLGGCRIFARILLFFYGYVWIQETYEDDPRARRPSVVVCNHVGFAELLYLAAKDGCCFVSKEANRALPVIGKVSELMQSIFVDRGGGGRAASTIMLERARAPPDTWPPLAVCPEGTTTTGHCMIHFHTGAFRAGLPVQPVVVSLPFSPTHGYDPSFCCCASIVTHILCLMMQPMNHLHVHHLAVHVPTDAERADPRLYANNVRRSMAVALNVNVYELTWADKLQFEPTKAKRELGKRLLAERHGGVAPPVPVFTQDAFGNTLESAKDK